MAKNVIFYGNIHHSTDKDYRKNSDYLQRVSNCPHWKGKFGQCANRQENEFDFGEDVCQCAYLSGAEKYQEDEGDEDW